MIRNIKKFIIIGIATLNIYTVFSAGPPENWAVLTFENCSKKDIFGIEEFAAQKFASQISQNPKYGSVAQDVIARALMDESLRLPIQDTHKIMRLGRSLRCFTVATGKICDLTIEDSSGLKRSKAKIEVRLYDTISGEIVNGADVIAYSSPAEKSQISDENLMKEAIDQAAYQAAQEILSHTLNDAYVQNVIKNKAVISLGTSSGYRPNLKVIVRRGFQFVSYGRVSDVMSDSGVIVLIEGDIHGGFRGDQKGLSAQDRVRPIILFPTAEEKDRFKGLPIKK